MHYFTQNTSQIFWGWGTAYSPDLIPLGTGTPAPQTLPLGTYGASTLRLRCGLDAFCSWSRRLGGLSPPPTVKILATSLKATGSIFVELVVGPQQIYNR